MMGRRRSILLNEESIIYFRMASRGSRLDEENANALKPFDWQMRRRVTSAFFHFILTTLLSVLIKSYPSHTKSKSVV